MDDGGYRLGVGLGSPWSPVVEYLDGPGLARLSATSRSTHVMSHSIQCDLRWRGLCAEWAGNCTRAIERIERSFQSMPPFACDICGPCMPHSPWRLFFVNNKLHKNPMIARLGEYRVLAWMPAGKVAKGGHSHLTVFFADGKVKTGLMADVDFFPQQSEMSIWVTKMAPRRRPYGGYSVTIFGGTEGVADKEAGCWTVSARTLGDAQFLPFAEIPRFRQPNGKFLIDYRWHEMDAVFKSLANRRLCMALAPTEITRNPQPQFRCVDCNKTVCVSCASDCHGEHVYEFTEFSVGTCTCGEESSHCRRCVADDSSGAESDPGECEVPERHAMADGRAAACGHWADCKLCRTWH